jgi:PAS domain S-box-containing protein
LSHSEAETILKLLGEALRRSEQEYRSLADVLSGSISLHLPEGAFIFANRSATTLFRARGAEELIGQEIFGFVHPEDRGIVQEQFNRALSGEIAGNHVQFRLLTPGKEEHAELEAFQFTYQGEPAVLVLTRGRDAREVSVAGHEPSGELLRSVLDRTSLGLLVVGRDRNVILANAAARTCLGLDEGVIGRDLLDAVPGGPDLLIDTVGEQETTIEMSGEEGNAKVIEFTSERLREDGPRVICFRDVTRSTEREERRRRAEQLSVAGKIASRFSHEIRNPLASILAGLQALEKEPALSTENSFLLELVLEEVRSTERLLKRLVDSVRTDFTSPRRIVVGPLLKNALESLQPLASARDTTLQLIAGPASASVTADEDAMVRVLGNLLENFLEASRTGDVIKLGWRDIGDQEKKSRLPGCTGSVLGIFGEDSGRGIPHDLSFSSIFRPFVTTKDSITGLGLALAQEIIEAHGGIFCVGEVPTGGMNFEILLPVEDQIPCWESREAGICAANHCVGPCEDCEVNQAGNGLFCWELMGRSHRMAKGVWPDACINCSIFSTCNLFLYYHHPHPRGKEG